MNKNVWLIPVMSIAMAGCIDIGDDDDDDNGASGPTASETISGKAADGYLQGAFACLDINDNKVCDATEPGATTGPNGDFSISATPEQAEANIIVEIRVGTIDQDDPDNPIDSAYTITAPPGYSFVSPLTTLVLNEMQSGSLDADAAESAVKSLLGTSLDLNKDYVAGSTASGDDLEATFATEFKKLHKVARVAARIIKDNVKKVKDAGGSVSNSDALKVIVTKVSGAVKEIANQVEAVGDDPNFDPATIAAVGSIAAATEVDVEAIEEEIQVAEDLKNATDVNMGTILTAGVYWLEEDLFFDFQAQKDRIFFGYGFVDFDGATQNDEFYFFNGVDFVLDDGDDDDDQNGGGSEDFLILAATGFELVEDEDEEGPDFVSTNADGSVRMNQGPFKVDLYGKEVDIAGKKISTTLLNTRNWLWADAVGGTATFAAGSKAYRLRQVVGETVYGLPYDQPSDNDHHGCPDDEAEGDENPSCNYVRMIDAANEILGEAAAAEDSLISAAPASAVGSLKGPIVYHEETTTGTKIVVAEMQSNGTVRYIEVRGNDNGLSGFKLLATSTYSSETVHGKTLLMFEIPDAVPSHFRGDDDGGPEFKTFFLVAYDGFWRVGVVLKKGTLLPDDAPFVMNEAAKNSAETAFDIENIDLNDGTIDIIRDPGQLDDFDDEDNIGEIFVPCRFGDSGWDDEAEMPIHLLGFDDFTKSVTDCRLSGNTLTGGGFTEADIRGKTFKVSHDSTLSFASTGQVGTLKEYEGDVVSDTEGLTWEIQAVNGSTATNYLVVTSDVGDIVAVFALIAKDQNEYLIKAYIKDIDDDGAEEDDDGFSSDLDLNNDHDGEVAGMVWVEETD